jgi:hypothetical protein
VTTKKIHWPDPNATLDEIDALPDRGTPLLTATIPVRTVSEANAHEHWRKRAKRAKEQRSTALLCFRARSSVRPDLPVIIRTKTLSRWRRRLARDRRQGSSCPVGVQPGEGRPEDLCRESRGLQADELTMTE